MEKERKPCVVFDIDGTIADGTHRLHHIKWLGDSPHPAEWRKDWGAYFSLLHLDEVIEPVAFILRAVHKAGAEICYCTGRPAEYIPATQKWLLNQNLPMAGIYHRAAGDFRDDNIVKPGLWRMIEADGFEIILIFDDRQRVVEAARSLGYHVAQVADGDY